MFRSNNLCIYAYIIDAPEVRYDYICYFRVMMMMMMLQKIINPRELANYCLSLVHFWNSLQLFYYLKNFFGRIISSVFSLCSFVLSGEFCTCQIHLIYLFFKASRSHVFFFLR